MMSGIGVIGGLLEDCPNPIGCPWQGVNEVVSCPKASKHKECIQKKLRHLHDPRSPWIGVKDSACDKERLIPFQLF